MADCRVGSLLTRKKWKIFFDLYQEEKILFIPGDRLPDGGNSQ
jgi:hypothetical protein